MERSVESYDDGYFAKATPRLDAIGHAPTPVLARKPYRVAIWVGVVVVLLAAAGLVYKGMRPPVPGSREDLAARLEEWRPSSMKETKSFYETGDGCVTELACPQYVGWYSITGSVGAARDEVIMLLEQRGVEYRQNPMESNLITAKDDGYMYFFVFHEPPFDGPLDRTGVLPPDVLADWSVSKLNPDVVPGS